MKKCILLVCLFLCCNLIVVQANLSPSVDGEVIEVVPGTPNDTPDSDEGGKDETPNQNGGTSNDHIDNEDDNNDTIDVGGSVNNENQGNGSNNLQGQDGIKWSFHEDFEKVEDPIQRKITQMNEGIIAAQVLEEDDILYHNDVDLQSLTLLSKIRDMRVTNTQGQNVSEDYTNVEVTWEEPRLNDNIEDLHILHYSTVRKRWEVFKPKHVDYEKKTITAFFYDLSPVGVLYKAKEKTVQEEDLVVTSVKNMNVYFVIVVFGIVLALYAFYKAREQEEAE